MRTPVGGIAPRASHRQHARAVAGGGVGTCWETHGKQVGGNLGDRVGGLTGDITRCAAVVEQSAMREVTCVLTTRF